MDASELARGWLDGAVAPHVVAQLDTPKVILVAWALKDLAYENLNSNPALVQKASARLNSLLSREDAEITAVAAWVKGAAHTLKGQMPSAIKQLDLAAAGFTGLGRVQAAAQTQIPKLIALAMLGRYEEAIACAQAAKLQFIAVGDERSAGKVELNLGSIFLGQDRYEAAGAAYRQAAVRFARAGDAEHSIMADIGLAGALTWQFDFDEALRLYDRATVRAQARGLGSTLSVIATNRGRLELHRGRFEAALKLLEAALREAELDGMPQELAEARRDMADLYLALNLLPEAVALYDLTIAACIAYDSPEERAWAEVQRAQAVARQGESSLAMEGFEAARTLFEAQDNRVGLALTDLRLATLDLRLGNAARALRRAEASAAAFEVAGVDGWRYEADLVATESKAALGFTAAAAVQFELLLPQTEGLPELQAACHAGLGMLLYKKADRVAAQIQLEKSIACVEQQRSALPGDEFRTAYGANKQLPHDTLVAMAMEDTGPGASTQLLRRLENARAKSLATAIAHNDHADVVDAASREQLRWLNEQWSLAIGHGDTKRATQLQLRTRELERNWLEQQRRIRAAAGFSGSSGVVSADTLDVGELQAQLADDAAMVVYGLVNDQLAACVVTRKQIRHVVTKATGLDDRIQQLDFQVNALRFGAQSLRTHAAQMLQRTRAHLQALYDLIWRPLAPLVADHERIIVAPHRSLHYIPFCALHDGQQSLLDRHELSLTPSATLWLGQPQSSGTSRDPLGTRLRRVAAVGHGGASLPHVANELQAVANAFRAVTGGSAALHIDEDATHASLKAALEGADVLHLACHGQFRADSPYFSSLQLADGPLTVRDAAKLPLNAQLVTLSACETALSRVAPGDELLGLLRGFLMAGAKNVIATRWTVDDASTASLMASFYGKLLSGGAPGAALRAAQLELTVDQPHPYHWAPFTHYERA